MYTLSIACVFFRTGFHYFCDILLIIVLYPVLKMFYFTLDNENLLYGYNDHIWSKILPFFVAASIPKGILIKIAISMEKKANSKVGAARSRISSEIG